MVCRTAGFRPTVSAGWSVEKQLVVVGIVVPGCMYVTSWWFAGSGVEELGRTSDESAFRSRNTNGRRRGG